MSALVPYNSHGRFHDKYFGAYQRLMEQNLAIPRPFANQWSFYSHNRYPFPDQMPFSSMTTGNSLMPFNQQQNYAQYIRRLNDVQMRAPKREAQRLMPPSRFSGTAWENTSGQLHIYEKETRYLPYPVFGGSGYGGGPGFTGGITTLLAPGGVGGGRDLPPKIRVIFLPNGTPSLQQPCAGALVRTLCEYRYVQYWFFTRVCHLFFSITWHNLYLHYHCHHLYLKLDHYLLHPSFSR